MRLLRPLTTLTLLPALGLAGLGALAAPAQAAAPTNDELAGAIALAPGTTAVDVTGATTSDDEPGTECGVVERSVWYAFTPEASGTYRLTTGQTDGSFPDTKLAVYSGPASEPAPADLTPVACNDDGAANAPQSDVTFRGEAGTTYYVEAGLFSTGGDKAFTLGLTALLPPGNDDFAAATVITGANGSVDGENTAASAEPGDPVLSGDDQPGGHSVWYSWTAPASGSYQFATLTPKALNPYIDTSLAVFTGDGLDDLTVVAENNDAGFATGWSRTVFEAVGGTTYRVLVDGFREYAASSGPFRLSWGAPPTPTTATLTAPRKADARSRITLSVKVIGLPGGKGTVYFYDAESLYEAAKVKNGKASITVKVSKQTGKHRYLLAFVPTFALAASDDSRVVKVVR